MRYMKPLLKVISKVKTSMNVYWVRLTCYAMTCFTANVMCSLTLPALVVSFRPPRPKLCFVSSPSPMSKPMVRAKIWPPPNVYLVMCLTKTFAPVAYALRERISRCRRHTLNRRVTGTWGLRTCQMPLSGSWYDVMWVSLLESCVDYRVRFRASMTRSPTAR